MSVGKQTLDPVPELGEGATKRRFGKAPGAIERQKSQCPHELEQDLGLNLAQIKRDLAHDVASVYFQIALAISKHSFGKSSHEGPVRVPVHPRKPDKQPLQHGLSPSGIGKHARTLRRRGRPDAIMVLTGEQVYRNMYSRDADKSWAQWLAADAMTREQRSLVQRASGAGVKLAGGPVIRSRMFSAGMEHRDLRVAKRFRRRLPLSEKTVKIIHEAGGHLVKHVQESGYNQMRPGPHESTIKA